MKNRVAGLFGNAASAAILAHQLVRQLAYSRHCGLELVPVKITPATKTDMMCIAPGRREVHTRGEADSQFRGAAPHFLK